MTAAYPPRVCRMRKLPHGQSYVFSLRKNATPADRHSAQIPWVSGISPDMKLSAVCRDKLYGVDDVTHSTTLHVSMLTHEPQMGRASYVYKEQDASSSCCYYSSLHLI